MIKISYSYKSDSPQIFEAEAASIIVGRSQQGRLVDLDLTPDLAVSRRHARLTDENGDYWLEDLGSKSGTWVNGHRIVAKTPVKPGDLIQLGQTTLRLSGQNLLPLDETADPPQPISNAPAMGARTQLFAGGQSMAESQESFLFGDRPSLLDTIQLDADWKQRVNAEITDAIVESRILEKIASTLDLEEVLKRIVEAAVELSGADEGSLLLLDEETNELYMRAAKGFGEKFANTFRQPVSEDNIAGQVMLKGEPILLNPDSPFKVKTGHLARSVLNLPIKQGGVSRGVLAVYKSGGQRLFAPSHLLLLTPLANYAASAIENARLFQKTSQLLTEAYALFELFEVVRSFNETRDLDDLLHLIGSLAFGRFGLADRVVVHLFDDHTGRLEQKVRIPPMPDRVGKPRGFAMGEGIAGRAFQENRAINVPNVKNEPTFATRVIVSGSLLVAPISVLSLCIGTISVASPSENAFKPGDEHLLTFFAALAGVAVENNRLFEAERVRATQLMVVAQLAEKLTSILNLDELLQQSATLIHQTFAFEDVVIKLYDPEADGLVFKVAVGLHADRFEPDYVQKLGEGMAGWAAQTGKTALANDTRQDPRYISRGLTETLSELDVPLKFRDKVIGVLNIQSQSLNAFNPHDVLALEALANQIAVAIENARLYERQFQLYQESQERLEAVERRNRELNSLRDILGALQSTLSLPEVLAQIATGVVNGLNYKAVMLSTIGEVNQQLTVQEFVLDPKSALLGLLEQGERLAGQKLVGNSASLERHKDNIGIQVCLDGQTRVTHKLHDIFKPVIGGKICRVLQKMFQLNAFAVLPIRSESKLFGVLYAGTQRKTISSADLEALQAFANQAALAIQNARQFDHVHASLRRRMRELQSLQVIDRLISSTPDLEMMLTSILDAALKLIGAESGNIVLADQETGVLKPRVNYPEGSISADKYQPGLTAVVAVDRKTARIADLWQTPWAETRQDVAVRSELAAPILVGDELVGVINIGSSRPDVFTEEDESLLEILATQTAVAIKTARYYQELEERRLRLLETERIAAMGDFASNMVHSINNSTGAIRVIVQLIRLKMSQGPLPPEFLESKLNDITASAEKTLEMVRNIRNPLQQMAAELVDINSCIDNGLRKIESLPATLDLTLNLDKELPPVMATRQLEEVFRNLVINAIEAMKGAGSLQISSQRIGQVVEAAVTDSGPGLSKNLSASTIFHLGASSKKDGLGYGLWWCKIFLNRFGGTIQLEPGLGTGCKFVVRLPLESKSNGEGDKP